ncbi:MAG TPA: hypothetical protein VFS10_19530 [Pyrinomonadaceae bacterium]|nr:hypothetical protein [Pyrinomonadaceae bacterium]
MSKKSSGAASDAVASENPTKAELQRRMDEARDSITETVSEIKTVVAHQYEEVRDTYETVKEGVGEVLDWREQFERNPVVWGAGAVSVGILIGVGLAHLFDEEEGKRGRGKSKEAGTGERLISELTGLADAVLPTISGKIKELFGLDLDDYMRRAREKRPAPPPPPKRLVSKGAAKKRAAKKRAAAKRPASAKKAAAKKGGASRRRAG